VTAILLIGAAIFACGFLPGIVGSIFFEQVWFIPGDGGHFDPVASFGTVQEFAGQVYQPYYLEARYVRLDGTLDLYADYLPEVTYRFYREVQADQAPPIGAGGSLSGRQYEVTQVTLRAPGQRRFSFNLGMDRDVRPASNNRPGEPMTAPGCSFADLWQVALTKDAPESAVAIIRYDVTGYQFRIQDTPIDLHFDATCKLKT
jgi:hypothetical protein